MLDPDGSVDPTVIHEEVAIKEEEDLGYIQPKVERDASENQEGVEHGLDSVDSRITMGISDEDYLAAEQELQIRVKEEAVSECDQQLLGDGGVSEDGPDAKRRRLTDETDQSLPCDVIDDLADTRGYTAQEWLSKEEPRKQVLTRFEKFLSTHKTFTKRHGLEKAMKSRIIRVAFDELASREPVLAYFLPDAPFVMLQVLDSVVSELVRRQGFKLKARVAISEYPILRTFREMRANQLVRVVAVVTDYKGVVPWLSVRKYECSECGYVFGPYVSSSSSESRPKYCPGCGKAKHAGLKVKTLYSYRNCRKITIGERADRTPPGRVPRTLDCILTPDLPNPRYKVGEHIDITGIHTDNYYDGSHHTDQGFQIFGTVLVANYIAARKSTRVAAFPQVGVAVELCKKLRATTKLYTEPRATSNLCTDPRATSKLFTAPEAASNLCTEPGATSNLCTDRGATSNSCTDPGATSKLCGQPGAAVNIAGASKTPAAVQSTQTSVSATMDHDYLRRGALTLQFDDFEEHSTESDADDIPYNLCLEEPDDFSCDECELWDEKRVKVKRMGSNASGRGGARNGGEASHDGRGSGENRNGGSGEVSRDSMGSGDVSRDSRGSGDVSHDARGSGDVSHDGRGSGDVSRDGRGSGDVSHDGGGSREDSHTGTASMSHAQTRIRAVYETDSDAPLALRKLVNRTDEKQRTELATMRCQLQSREQTVSAGENSQVRFEVIEELLCGQESSMEWSPMETFAGVREKFVPEKTGPVTTRPDSAYDAFRCFWDDEILEHIVVETNRYASSIQSQEFHRHWVPTNADEILVLFGFWIWLGIIKVPVINFCFIDDPLVKVPAFSGMFTKKRYTSLCRALSFCNFDLRPQDASLLYSLGPLVEHLNAKFQANYIPAQNIRISKTCSATLRTKKNERQTVMVFILHDCATGYVSSLAADTMHYYPGSSDARCQLLEMFAKIFAKTVRPILGKGYTLFTNFFNSPTIARYLKRNKTDCVGKITCVKLGLPPLVSLANLRQGECVARHSGDVVVMACQADERITTISTYHGLQQVQGTSDERKPGGNVNKPVFMPQVVADFNKNASLESFIAQALTPYVRVMKYKWRVKFLKQFLNYTVTNTRELYWLSKNKRDESGETRDLACRISLVDQILHKHLRLVPVKSQEVRFEHCYDYDQSGEVAASE